MTPLESQVTALFGALPPDGDNPIGKAARAALVNRIQGVLPGVHSQPWPEPAQPPFRDIFFPGWAADPNAAAITPLTGLDDAWWAGFSVVMLCQAMFYITSDLRPQLNQAGIDSTVAMLNVSLSPKLNAYYTALLTGLPSSPVAAAFNAINPSDRPNAAQIYAGYLQNPAWIVAKIGQAASGQWHDPAWELLHHWLKLAALGMPASQIDALITTLANANLPVPDAVGAGKWETCTSWLPGPLDWNDIQAMARNGILEAEYVGDVSMNEENSFEFTAIGQPGNPWRPPPHSSCFAAGTLVLMGDGSARAIELVCVGDVVQTRAGARPVVAAVSVQHAGDALYGMEGCDLRFSQTHPFLTLAGAMGQPGPKLAAADPLRLMHITPALSDLGVAALGAGCPPLAAFDKTVQPFAAGALSAHPVTPGRETIYDLVTAFDEQGNSEYIVGDGHRFLAVHAESPRYGSAPESAAAMMDVVSLAWPAIRSALGDFPADAWTDLLYRGLWRLAAQTLRDAIRGITPTAAAAVPAAWATAGHLAQVAHGQAAALMTGNGSNSNGYDQGQGACFAALMTVFGNPVREAVTAGWRDFSLPAGEAADQFALTILSLECVADCGLPPDVSVTAEITVGEAPGAVVAQRLAPLPPMPAGSGYRPIAQTVHYPRETIPAGGSVPVRIGFGDGSGADFPVTGRSWLPGPAALGYRRVSVPLFDATQRVVGQFVVDLRPSTATRAATEAAARSGWTPARQTAFAHALGQQLGALIAARFGAAVAPLRPRS